MLSIELEPTGTGNAGWTFSLDGGNSETGSDPRNRSVVFWAVKLGGRQSVRLKTGGELKDLPGRIRCFLMADTTTTQEARVHWGELHYYKGASEYAFPESYELDLYVSQAEFGKLRSLLAARMIPHADVKFGKDDAPGVQIGWEPDGRGMDWDNEKHQTVKIKGCSFAVDVGLPTVPDDVEDQRDRATAQPLRADMVEILAAIRRATEQVESLGRRLLPVLWVSVALLAVLALRAISR